MAYNEALAERVRRYIKKWNGINEKKMFGGIGFMAGENMCCGVYKEFLILRLDEKQADEVLKHPGAKPFDITGRPMKGWIMINNVGLDHDTKLFHYLDISYKYAVSLPPQKKKKM